jgi:hypothetical protein
MSAKPSDVDDVRAERDALRAANVVEPSRQSASEIIARGNSVDV